jgi:hypothetical protein
VRPIVSLTAAVVVGALTLLAACGILGVAEGTLTPGPATGAVQDLVVSPFSDTVPPVVPPTPGTIVAGDQMRPDAFVLHAGKGYYLYSGQVLMVTEPIMVSYSTRIGLWPRSRPAMTDVPTWAANGFTWSPDVSMVGSRYILYFDALARRSALAPRFSGQCIGTASSGSPLGPFVPSAHPLVCQFDHHGSIDPRVFTDQNGDVWMLWKSDDNAVKGTTAATHLYSQRLSADGLSLTGPRHELLSADETWQHQIIEAPDMVEAGGNYWLFYSGGWFNQTSYAIGLASCTGPAGPCQDMPSGPWFASNSQGNGPGEPSLFQGASGQWWMTYSPWAWGTGATEEDVPVMPVALTRVDFTPTGPMVAAPAPSKG